MEFEASFTLRQIKQQLRRKKYKFVVKRVSKLLEKEEELPYACDQFIFMVIYYQSTAVNKLLERNLMKKYKYHSQLVESLLQLLLQNIAQCHKIVSEEIKQNTIFEAKQSSSDANMDFLLNTKKCSLEDKYSMNSQLTRNNSHRLTNGFDQIPSGKRHLQLFLRLVNNSSIFIMKTIDVYCGEMDSPYSITEFILSMNTLKFTNIANFLSQIKMKLYYGKLLSLSATKEEIARSEKIIQEVTQNLLDILHMINITNSKLSKSNQEYKIKKYQEQQKECFKLIIIAIVISNKNNMKLSKQCIATLGIQIFRVTLQSLTPKYSGFRKLMLPELYLQEQFLKYRVEKQELAEIITLYFNEKVQHIEQVNKQKLLNNSNKILDFYNKQHNPCEEQMPTKPKITYSEINTIKSIGAVTGRKRGTATALRTISQEEEHTERRSNILTKMIINQIDEINGNYLKFKAINNSKVSKPRSVEKIKSSFYKIQSTQLLKKQRLSQSKRQEDGSRTMDVFTRKEMFQQDERQFNKAINGSKQKLARKNREKVLHLIQNPVEDQQEVVEQIKDIQQSEHFLKSYIYPQQKVIQIEEKHLKKSMLAIAAKKRTQMFLQILIQNRQSLGIKKIAEKLQALRKKEQEKLKMFSNRLTSSINRSVFSINKTEHQRSNFNKFQVIAKEILKRHISFQSNKVDSAQKAFIESENKKKLIEANYTLGQKSIDTVKRKLQSKMSKGQKVVDKYHKNEQIFKLKLKKLGSTNFILKKSLQDSDNIDSSLFDY